MKIRAIHWVIPAVALITGACEKKAQDHLATEPQPANESTTPAAPTEPKAPAADTKTPATETKTPAAEIKAPAPEVKTPPLTPDQRAAKIGFAKHLPQDTEVVMTFQNGSKSIKRLQSGKLWKLFKSEMGMEFMGEDENAGPVGDEKDGNAAATNKADEPAVDEPMGPAALFGREFTIALGKSTGTQTGNLLTLNRRTSYFQMRTLAKALAEAAKEGGMSEAPTAMAEPFGPEMMKFLISDPESGLALFEKMNMPPLYLAFKTTPSGRDSAAQEIASAVENLASLEQMVEPVETTKADQKFSGYKISGAKLSASMTDNRNQMEDVMDAASIDRLIAAVAKKDLVVLSGTLGDYVILFIGSSVDDLKIAADEKQSLAASDAMQFCDPYVSKELAALVYGQKAALDQISLAAGGVSDFAIGLRDGLSGTTGLGETRDLETLLDMVAEREKALRKLCGNEAMGVVAYFENGLKIESFGGTDNGMVDWKTPNQLASLGKPDDVAMFANVTTEAAYDAKAREYFEALMETGYAIAMKVAELPAQGQDMAEFKKWAKIIDTKFRTDLVTLWDSFNGNFGGGLGSERALVLDLKGSVPAIPGLDQTVIDQGKFPRISVIAPVKDRNKLANSWQNINTSITSALAKTSEITGEKIPMQKPISSDKDGYTTWFFSMPFFSNDFMPSVTVGEKWFAASTSKDQALDLINQASKSTETGTGLVFNINFKALQKFATETHGLMTKNPTSFHMSEHDIKEALKLINAFDDLDKLTVHARREGGVMRTSVHFKTR